MAMPLRGSVDDLPSLASARPPRRLIGHLGMTKSRFPGLSASLATDGWVVALSALSLALPWNDLTLGLLKPAVVASVLAVLAATGLPYLAGTEAGTHPSGTTATVLSILRVVLTTPLLVLVAMILAHAAGGRSGVGPGVALGVCAALLTLRPRAGSPESPPPGPTDPSRTRTGPHQPAATVVLQWSAVVLASAAALWGALDAVQPLRHGWWEPVLWAAALPALGVCAALVMLATDLAWDPAPAADVTTTYAGLWFVANVLLSWGWVGGHESLHVSTPFSPPYAIDPGLGGALSLLGAGAVLARHAAACRRHRTDNPARVQRWSRLVLSLLAISGILLITETLRMVLLLTADTVGLSVDTPLVAALAALQAASLAMVFACRWLMQHRPALGRLVTSVLAALTGAGNVYFVVATRVPIRVESVLLSLLALSIVAVLTVPGAMRVEYGPLVPRNGLARLVQPRAPEFAGAPAGPWEEPTWPTPEELFDDPPSAAPSAPRGAIASPGLLPGSPGPG